MSSIITARGHSDDDHFHSDVLANSYGSAALLLQRFTRPQCPMPTVRFFLAFKSGVQGMECCMERLIDTSTWASLSVTDLNDELVDAEDIIGLLAESAVNDVVYIDGFDL